MDDALAPLRKQIDDLDAQIVALLNKRAEVVVEVGRHKRQSGGSIYAPEREQAVLKKLRELNRGPLPDRTLEAVWRELMSGSFVLEKPLRIAYVGPPGGFAHQAAAGKFGQSVEYAPVADVAAVADAVIRGHATHGVVPAENGGAILGGGELADTLDALLDPAARGISICAEVPVALRYDLLGNEPWDEVREIAGKPEVLGQCRAWLSGTGRDRRLREAVSLDAAAALAAREPGVAAVAPRMAAERHGLRPLFEHVGDEADRVARYFVLAHAPAGKSAGGKTGILFLTDDRPGTLVAVLDVFRERGVNLTDIEKRPTGIRRQRDVFYIDVEGHAEDEAVQQAIDVARQHAAEMIVVGSYPAASGVVA
jgi:chorismate mutase/prephenate dehydratase